MKKILTLLLLLTVQALCYGQDMSVESFTMDQSDMDAKVYAPKQDLNGNTAALIKIETSESGFAFDTGGMGVLATEQKVGEVWVYMPAGVIRLQINHQQLGVLKYEFPIAIKAATVYRMKLTSNKVETIVHQSAGGHYLQITSTPAEVELIVDGGAPIAITGGVGSSFQSYGEHTYTVQAKHYKPSSGVVKIGNERKDLTINLEPNFGYIEVNSTPSGATVEINDMEVGVTPYRSPKLALGEHQLRVSATNFAPHSQTVNLTDGTATVTVSPALVSYLSGVTISCTMSDAKIIINDTERGTGNWSGELLPGTYELKAEKSGHRAAIQQLVVERNTPQSITLNAPTPMYGTLNISAAQSGVTASIDGEELGSLPNIFSNILVGKHTLTLSKSGFSSATTTVEIKEGAVTAHNQPALISIADTEEYKTKVEPILKRTNYIFSDVAYKAMKSPVNLVIPDGFTSISRLWDEAENNNQVCLVKSVTIPKSVTTIRNSAFKSCKNLTSVTIPNSVTSIGNAAFWNCDNLTSVNIPNSVTSIGDWTFGSCDNLTSINIPNSVTSIGNKAFGACHNLTSINIPNSVTTIGYNAFWYCDNLTSINIPNSVTSIGYSAFENCDNLTSINIPNSVTTIGNNAFRYCDNLTSINIPNSVTTIGEGAFEHSMRSKTRVVTISKSSPIYKQLIKEKKQIEKDWSNYQFNVID